MTATAPWLASIEALLNRNIDSSAQASVLARRLGGTALRIDISGFTVLEAAVAGGRLALLAQGAEEPDATIKGSPPALLALMRSREAPVGSNVLISGNAEVANLYRELLTAARPDVEEELSRLVGDLPARQIARLARAAGGWFSHARRTARENIAEYLTEESRDLVSGPEVEEFLRGVDAARESADRIDARLKVLERRQQEGR